MGDGMKHDGRMWGCAAAALVLVASLASTPALADVRQGVEAWSRGDYAGAVAQWQGPAAAGDADAMFNLGQAYRLGRGVAQDAARAEELYRRAAELGHLPAADTYGLMLFQDGRHQQALPYVQDAARRGDPRSQYLLGIAHFNGDLMPRDWVRAYALLTLANAAGLPQAASAIGEMDAHIAMADRQRATVLADQLRAEAQAARDAELAAADLGTPAAAVATDTRVPRPAATTAGSPSIAAARTAIAEARSAPGTASPATAGAGYAPAPDSAAATPRVPAAAPAPHGPWRVQLGAFSVRENAQRLWARVSGRPELAGHPQLLLPSGRVTRLQAGGFASQAEARAACDALARSGIDCLVTRN